MANTQPNRRNFLKNSSTLLAGLPILAYTSSLEGAPTVKEKINIGFVGTGLRGQNHINNILQLDHVVSSCFCDIDPEAVKLTTELYAKHHHPTPKVYSGDVHAFKEMLASEDLDAVLVATNWAWHTPVIKESLSHNIYTAVEVSGATSIDECWEWVHAVEASETHLMFLENVCYRRDVMAVLNMVRDNVFGELLHCRGGYLHDLRHVKLEGVNNTVNFGEGGVGEARWRTHHSLHRNGELYPTHGLGPIAHALNINRGNRLTKMTSSATKARSLNKYIIDHAEGGEDSKLAHLPWQLGDIVTSTISTALGETIVLTHDTNSPRPYSLGFRIQGTQGLIDLDYGTQRIYVEGESPSHQWEEATKWIEKYDHPLWQRDGAVAINGGHGGMDYFLDRAFVESVRRDIAPPIDVYDAAAWKVITPLSESSIRQGGMPQEIPDFTNGRWMHRNPIFGLREDF